MTSVHPLKIMAIFIFDFFVTAFCRQLSELALLYCQRIGNYALCEIGKGCKFLQALHLVDCASIGDDAICSIASGCKNLKKLHIRRCYEVIISLSSILAIDLSKLWYNMIEGSRLLVFHTET